MNEAVSSVLASAGSGGFQRHADTVLSAVVDNVQRMYYARVAPKPGEMWEGSDMGIWAMVITYQSTLVP